MIKLAFFAFILFGCGKTETVQIPAGQTRIIEVPTAPPSGNPPPLQPTIPNHVNYDTLTQSANNDIDTLSEIEQPNIRYVTTFEFYNPGGREQTQEEKGINFGLNTISNESRVFKATPVNDTKTIYRIDLDEIGMTRGMWKFIESRLTLQIKDKTRRGDALKFKTQAAYPIVFASDFFLTVMQADASTEKGRLYYEVTQQEILRPDYERQIFGVSFQDRVNAEDDVFCAAGGASQIAIGKNRAICIGEGVDGYASTTWDTSLALNGSAFENPFIPELARAGGRVISNKIFPFIAQEDIFIKKNGFMGFRLNGNNLALGQPAEVVAPTDVVLDTKQSGPNLRLDPAIRIGACANCHIQPYIAFTDQINPHVQQNQFNGLEKFTIATYHNQSSFSAQGNLINQEYFDTVKKIGINPGDPNFMVENLVQPIRGELSAGDIAGFTGLTLPDFLAKLRGAPQSQVVLGSLFTPGGKVQLQDFQKIFGLLQEEINLFVD